MDIDLAAVPVHRLARVDSTSLEVQRRVATGAVGPFWVIGDEQTAGRGRGPNAWLSPPGNLYTSLLLPMDDVSPGMAATFGFVVSLAVRDAIAGAFSENDPAPALMLKWPNDVLCGGAKICGILLQSAGTKASGGVSALIVGCGINCASSPDIPGRRTTSVAAAGGDADLGRLFDAYAVRLAHYHGLWRRGGFSAIRQLWLAHAGETGRRMEIRLPKERFEATFEGLNEEGAFLAGLADGSRRAVAAGEVFLLDEEMTQ